MLKLENFPLIWKSKRGMRISLYRPIIKGLETWNCQKSVATSTSFILNYEITRNKTSFLLLTKGNIMRPFHSWFHASNSFLKSRNMFWKGHSFPVMMENVNNQEDSCLSSTHKCRWPVIASSVCARVYRQACVWDEGNIMSSVSP